MRAVVLNGPNDFFSTDVEKPVIGDNDMLLEMKKAAICGTDMRILAGTKTKGVRYPSVIGHEMCGVISEVGKNVTGFKEGDKVAIANVIPCGSCPACLEGRENACMNRKAIGYEFNGGFEEYVFIPEIAIKSGNVIKLPEDVSFTAGALIEPLACCIRGLKNAGTGECTIEVNTIHYNEITVNGSTAYKRSDYLEAADMVITKKINLDKIATHTFKIDEFQQAYELCKSGQGLKVIIEP